MSKAWKLTVLHACAVLEKVMIVVQDKILELTKLAQIFDSRLGHVIWGDLLQKMLIRTVSPKSTTHSELLTDFKIT